jgi:hypothetical protein
LVAKKVD